MPFVTKILSGVTPKPYPLVKKFVSATRKCPSPCSAPYCRNELLDCDKRNCAASRIKSRGRSERDGSPSPRSITSGGTWFWIVEKGVVIVESIIASRHP